MTLEKSARVFSYQVVCVVILGMVFGILLYRALICGFWPYSDSAQFKSQRCWIQTL
jgi:hypothetical protein